jgi:DNA-binding response OmpR family regulator
MFFSIKRQQGINDKETHMGLFTAVTSLFGERTCLECNDKNRHSVELKHKPTVLVIDDDANFLQMMRSLLGHAGYGVLTSSTGPEGLDMLRYDPCDVAVVLLDFKMPKLNGADTLKHLRKLNCRVKVIGLSGIPVNQISKSFLEGVEQLVIKPFDLGELLLTIDSVLGGNSTTQPAAPVSV